MRRTALYTAILATLPLAAGFAFAPSSAAAQTMVMPSQGDASLLRQGQLETQIRELTGQLEQREFQLRQLQESYENFVEHTNSRLKALENGGAAANATNAGGQAGGFTTSGAAHSGAGVHDNNVSHGGFGGEASAPSYQNYGQQNHSGGYEGGATPPMPNQPNQPHNTHGADDAYMPQDGAASGHLGSMTGQNASGAGAAGGAITSGRPQVVSAAQAYDQAFGYLQEKNYKDAENGFQDFLKNHAEHSLAGNAQYWLGEAYYAQTQYTAAARTFAKAYQDYPHGQKAPDALFKLALTLEKMDKKQDACLTMSELRKRFPSGPASILRRADEETQRMQCQV